MTERVMPGDPYRRCGLAMNPFARDALHPVAFIERDGIRQAPPPPGAGCFVEVLGVRGAGKSTLLAHWRDQQPGPYHWVPDDHGRWARPPSGPIAYWDEVDRMAPMLRRRGFRQAARAGSTLVVGTHVSLAAAAERAGFREVTSIELPAITTDAMRDWINACIERVRLSDAAEAPQISEVCEVCDDIVAQIVRAASGSWRTAADELHALFADRVRAISESANTDR